MVFLILEGRMQNLYHEIAAFIRAKVNESWQSKAWNSEGRAEVARSRTGSHSIALEEG